MSPVSVRRWLARRQGRLEEVAARGRLAPTDPSAVSRARRTAAAVQLAGDWVWPFWLERQRDPGLPDFVPQGDLPFVANVTHRNWTVVGNLDSDRLALVDPRGLVTLGADGWSLDWWIGADDRWHVPSREVGVRQRLVDASPVVETAVRIPGGDAVQRVYAIRRSSQDGGGELVVVEVENQSKLPVALALAVRPANPRGVAEVEQIDLSDTTVLVDGRPALLLPKPPSRVAASTLAGGDSAHVVLAGTAEPEWPGPVRCLDGLAQAAVVYPLAHGATLRVALPSTEARMATFPTAVPTAAHVAKGWEAQSRQGLRLDLPDPRLAEAVEANRRFLLLLHHRATVEPTTGSRLPVRDAVRVVATLDRCGFHPEATDLLASYAGHEREEALVQALDGLDPGTTTGRERGAVRSPKLVRASDGGLADALRQRAALADGRALVAEGDPTSLDPAATLQLATVELLAGDVRCLDRLSWLLDVATPTWTWPTLLHPRLSDGTAGDGHDVAVTAAFLSFVRDLLVREDGDGLVLASAVPDAWLGQGWEVHDAPTDHGRLSYAVRWHGTRPALLWELEPHDRDGDDGGGPAVRLSAPGLDPGWSSTERRGDALLGPVERAGVVPVSPPASLS